MFFDIHVSGSAGWDGACAAKKACARNYFRTLTKTLPGARLPDPIR